LFEVCLTRFSQVFRPIFPTPKRSIFLLCKSSILSKIYLTAAYETDVAPEESFVSFLILLLACITELKSLSRYGLIALNFLEIFKLFLICAIISKSPKI
jgi:hypothetical protein